MSNRPLILASASPRRHELLAAAGFSFQVEVVPVEERHDLEMPAEELCQHNAQLKARAAAVEFPQAIVIGADTLVFLESRPLGKPANMDEARLMLQQLAGKTHTVCTGVAIVADGICEVFADKTAVTFKSLTASEIENYFYYCNPLDKAGAYGIQDSGDLIVEKISGSFANVMGLPIEKLGPILHKRL